MGSGCVNKCEQPRLIHIDTRLINEQIKVSHSTSNQRKWNISPEGAVGTKCPTVSSSEGCGSFYSLLFCHDLRCNHNHILSQRVDRGHEDDSVFSQWEDSEYSAGKMLPSETKKRAV